MSRDSWESALTLALLFFLISDTQGRSGGLFWGATSVVWLIVATIRLYQSRRGPE